MKIIIIGRSGQLACELLATCPEGIEAKAFGRSDINITDAKSVLNLFSEERPHCVINASAYTAVDKAESDREEAFAINDAAVANIANACKAVNSRLIHVSTDFVFGPVSAAATGEVVPLMPNAPCEPMGVYGASKFAGEQVIQETLPEHSVIVRSAWVYSCYGNNFVKTMLKLMATKPELGVIYDQIGTPTWAKGLAQWIWRVANMPAAKGVFHWTDAGVASWYDFAKAIQELAIAKGLLDKAIPIKPLPTSGYPTPAKRPGYSVLNKTTAEALTDTPTKYWREQLSAMLDDLKNSQS